MQLYVFMYVSLYMCAFICALYIHLLSHLHVHTHLACIYILYIHVYMYISYMLYICILCVMYIYVYMPRGAIVSQNSIILLAGMSAMRAFGLIACAYDQRPKTVRCSECVHLNANEC